MLPTQGHGFDLWSGNSDSIFLRAEINKGKIITDHFNIYVLTFHGYIYRERERAVLGTFMGFPGGSVLKNLPPNAGDIGSVPGSGRSPGDGMATHSTH